MTLGDVLAAVALVVTTGFAVFCAMVLSALLFPSRTTRAAREIEFHPWKCVLMGAFLGLPWALIGLIVFQVPSPVFRVIGGLIVISVLVLAAAGSGGLAKLVAQRVAQSSKLDTTLTSVSVGSFLIVGAALLPVIGWLFLAPVFTLCALGAGFRTAFGGKKQTSAVQVSEAS
jgi:hypothetical protein